jgi:hypothetical protein
MLVSGRRTKMADDAQKPEDRPDAPRHVRVASRADLESAVIELLRAARRIVRCAERDLSRFGLSGRDVVQLIERMLVADRAARVRLLADETGWLESGAARLRRLQWTHSHALEIRIASSDDPVGDDAWLLADELHALRLQPATTVQGDLWLRQAPHARALIAAFDRRWDAAAHSLPTVPLGL